MGGERRTVSVVGAVANAAAALQFTPAARAWTFILLDIEMPGVDGLTALLTTDRGGRRGWVVIVSSCYDRGRRRRGQALALGAASWSSPARRGCRDGSPAHWSRRSNGCPKRSPTHPRRCRCDRRLVGQQPSPRDEHQ